MVNRGRVSPEDKSKPIKTLTFSLPLIFSISGDQKLEKEMKEYLEYVNRGRKEKCKTCGREMKKITMNDFLLKHILDTFSVNSSQDLINHGLLREFVNTLRNNFWKKLSDESSINPSPTKYFSHMWEEDKKVQNILKKIQMEKERSRI